MVNARTSIDTETLRWILDDALDWNESYADNTGREEEIARRIAELRRLIKRVSRTPGRVLSDAIGQAPSLRLKDIERLAPTDPRASQITEGQG
jgi:hypothetical protein